MDSFSGASRSARSGATGGMSASAAAQSESTQYVRALRRNLVAAYSVLTSRCLYESAKWATEAVVGIGKLPGDTVNLNDDFEDDDAMDQSDSDDPPMPPDFEAMPRAEMYRYNMAKACFDCREYDRAARYLDKCVSPKCIFLRLYARYISGEKKKEEQSEVILGPLDGEATPNKQLVDAINELEHLFRTRVSLRDDPFLLYIYGIVLIKHKCEDAAVEPLIRAVKIYPYNWGAWTELACCIAAADKLPPVLHQLVVPLNATATATPDEGFAVMAKMFYVVTSQELFQATDAVVTKLDNLDTIFPTFQFLRVQRAMLCYHALDYTAAEHHFDSVLSEDPYRLDEMDMYSNILYVTEQNSKLAYLAQLASATDMFRPETCCIVANYYSLKSEHEKAVAFYRRALTLNRNCLGAWTLMGHEYVELKNIRAAIESYRRALSVNSKDVRAWYGLGQAYEVIEMYYYSFFYYQRASALKPYDYKMWTAVANCFEKLQRPADAIKAYTRALELADNADTVLMLRLASLHAATGDAVAAARYNQRVREIEQQQLEGGGGGVIGGGAGVGVTITSTTAAGVVDAVAEEARNAARRRM
ncbi:anaphase promoting complex subunit 8 [Limtongia smithiae]|uniref:anaphase promoting complex subunit 8 n=1 Tax=Limtongia smithiae TaxID=1125753 RepID=UPI0034CEFE92